MGTPKALSGGAGGTRMGEGRRVNTVHAAQVSPNLVCQPAFVRWAGLFSIPAASPQKAFK